MSGALAPPVRLPLATALAVLPAPSVASADPNGAAGGRYRSVGAGGVHACGVLRDRKVRCWGDNGSGQTDVPRALR